MQSLSQPLNGGYGPGAPGGGQYVPNQYFSVPTQNRFGPLGEWVGYSMGIHDTMDDRSDMEVQWIPVQNKRKRFNTGSTGTGMGPNFSTLSLDEKLLHMFEKLQNMEQSNQTIAQFSQNMNNVQCKVGHIENRMTDHDLFLKVLAYKSIDIEARTRRCNLIFHGLAEFKNERLTDILRDFLWDEMGIDCDDLFIDRVHRLGSFTKAKQRQHTENPRRPVIIAFQDYRSVEKVMDAAYMLRNSKFSVTRDYPRELVAARQRLTLRYKAERANFNNKVAIEYPAKLVVNGKIVADEFPDWYSVLACDRYQLANGNMDLARAQQTVPYNLRQAQNSASAVTVTATPGVSQDAHQSGRAIPARSYAQVVSTAVRPQFTNVQSNTVPGTVPMNIPRHCSVNSTHSQIWQGSGFTTSTTMSTTTTTVFTTAGGRPFMSVGRNANSDFNPSRDQQTYHNL